MHYPWYQVVDDDELQQGDILLRCPIIVPSQELRFPLPPDQVPVVIQLFIGARLEEVGKFGVVVLAVSAALHDSLSDMLPAVRKDAISWSRASILRAESSSWSLRRTPWPTHQATTSGFLPSTTAISRRPDPPENAVRLRRIADFKGSRCRPTRLPTSSHADMVGADEDRTVRVDLDHQVHRQIPPVSPTRDSGASASARRLSTDSSTTSTEAGRQVLVGLARQEVGRMAGSTCVREARDRHRVAAEAFSGPLDEAQQEEKAGPASHS